MYKNGFVIKQPTMVDIRGAFNKFPEYFVPEFKIAVDSWTFSMLLFFILWDGSLYWGILPKKEGQTMDIHVRKQY